MLLCPRKLARAVKVFILVGFNICVFASLVLLVRISVDNPPFSLKRKGANDSTALGLDQLQRGLLSRSDNKLTIAGKLIHEDFSQLDKTTRFDVVKRVFDISPAVTAAQNTSEFSFQIDSTPTRNPKFFFVLGHYEQLGKTTENLLQLAAVAARMKRSVVQPFVRDSRMCGLQAGYIGEERIKRRHFRPLSVYFNVKHMNNLLSNAGYASLVELDYYRMHCSSGAEKTTLLHILYDDEDTRDLIAKWYNLSTAECGKVLEETKLKGWSNCSFIDKGLSISKRIGNVNVGRQICIDPEIVKDIDVFEKKVLQGDSCVVIVHWRGIGKGRTHFEIDVRTEPRDLVHNLRPSHVILNELKKIKTKLGLNNPYIAVHIRAERQLEWYGVEKLLKCFSVLVKYVIKLKHDHKINQVFLATDLTDFGSDTLIPPINKDTALAKRLKGFQDLLIRDLKPILYMPRRTRDWLFMDRGVVAITEMKLLIDGTHLVTLGSGTFQEWILDVFLEQHSKDEDLFWSVTRVCNKEEKNTSKKPGNNFVA